MQQIEINLFQFIKSYKKRPKNFLISMIIVVIITLIFAFTRPILFEARVIFYPLKESESDPRILDRNLIEEQKIDLSEKFISYASSREVKDSLALKFNLFNRYEIKDSDDFASYKNSFYLKLNSNLNFGKVANGGVEVQVTDESKDTVALMANYITYLIDKHFSNLIQQRNLKILGIYKKRFLKSEETLNELNFEIENQKEMKNINIMLSKNNQMKLELGNYYMLKDNCGQFNVFTTTEIKTIDIVEPAQPALKKYKPNRTVIFITGILIGLLAWFGFYMVKDTIQNNAIVS